MPIEDFGQQIGEREHHMRERDGTRPMKAIDLSGLGAALFGGGDPEARSETLVQNEISTMGKTVDWINAATQNGADPKTIESMRMKLTAQQRRFNTDHPREAARLADRLQKQFGMDPMKIEGEQAAAAVKAQNEALQVQAKKAVELGLGAGDEPQQELAAKMRKYQEVALNAEETSRRDKATSGEILTAMSRVQGVTMYGQVNRMLTELDAIPNKNSVAGVQMQQKIVATLEAAAQTTRLEADKYILRARANGRTITAQEAKDIHDAMLMPINNVLDSVRSKENGEILSLRNSLNVWKQAFEAQGNKGLGAFSAIAGVSRVVGEAAVGQALTLSSAWGAHMSKVQDTIGAPPADSLDTLLDMSEMIQTGAAPSGRRGPGVVRMGAATTDALLKSDPAKLGAADVNTATKLVAPVVGAVLQDRPDQSEASKLTDRKKLFEVYSQGNGAPLINLLKRQAEADPSGMTLAPAVSAIRDLNYDIVKRTMARMVGTEKEKVSHENLSKNKLGFGATGQVRKSGVEVVLDYRGLRARAEVLTNYSAGATTPAEKLRAGTDDRFSQERAAAYQPEFVDLNRALRLEASMYKNLSPETAHMSDAEILQAIGKSWGIKVVNLPPALLEKQAQETPPAANTEDTPPEGASGVTPEEQESKFAEPDVSQDEPPNDLLPGEAPVSEEDLRVEGKINVDSKASPLMYRENFFKEGEKVPMEPHPAKKQFTKDELKALDGIKPVNGRITDTNPGVTDTVYKRYSKAAVKTENVSQEEARKLAQDINSAPLELKDFTENNVELFTLVASSEGFGPSAYFPSAKGAGDNLTLGFGHTENVGFDSTITKGEAATLLWEELDKRRSTVEKDLKKWGIKDLNNNQVQALTSFQYNVRSKWWDPNNNSFIRQLAKSGPPKTEKEKETFKARWRAFKKGGAGLSARRDRELELFFKEPETSNE